MTSKTTGYKRSFEYHEEIEASKLQRTTGPEYKENSRIVRPSILTTKPITSLAEAVFAAPIEEDRCSVDTQPSISKAKRPLRKAKKRITVVDTLSPGSAVATLEESSHSAALPKPKSMTFMDAFLASTSKR